MSVALKIFQGKVILIVEKLNKDLFDTYAYKCKKFTKPVVLSAGNTIRVFTLNKPIKIGKSILHKTNLKFNRDELDKIDNFLSYTLPMHLYDMNHSSYDHGSILLKSHVVYRNDSKYLLFIKDKNIKIYFPNKEFLNGCFVYSIGKEFVEKYNIFIDKGELDEF